MKPVGKRKKVFEGWIIDDSRPVFSWAKPREGFMGILRFRRHIWKLKSPSCIMKERKIRITVEEL